MRRQNALIGAVFYYVFSPSKVTGLIPPYTVFQVRSIEGNLASIVTAKGRNLRAIRVELLQTARSTKEQQADRSTIELFKMDTQDLWELIS